MVNKRDNTISSRETFAAINRSGNPVMKATFTMTTPDNKAHLSSPLTLEKCLMFESGMLEFELKYIVEFRYTNYVDSDLNYELADSNFYELSQHKLHRCLSEKITHMTKSEFLSMLKRQYTSHYHMYDLDQLGQKSTNHVDYTDNLMKIDPALLSNACLNKDIRGHFAKYRFKNVSGADTHELHVYYNGVLPDVLSISTLNIRDDKKVTCAEQVTPSKVLYKLA